MRAQRRVALGHVSIRAIATTSCSGSTKLVILCLIAYHWPMRFILMGGQSWKLAETGPTGRDRQYSKAALQCKVS